VNVKFSLIESNEETKNAPPSASNIKMEINLLLDETVLPTVDTFLKEAIPLAINFDQKRGDTLAIIRKDFPNDPTVHFHRNNAVRLKIIGQKSLKHSRQVTTLPV